MKEERIHEIIENNLHDPGITASEYYYAGYQYETGLGVSRIRRDLALLCYERASAMGDASAMLSLANWYRHDDNMDEYYKWLLEAAMDGGSLDAILELGELYFTGEYVHQDLKKAYRYFEIASTNGVDGAKYYIAYYAENGILEPKDERKAITYYIGGAKEMDERCCKRLEELHIVY